MYKTPEFSRLIHDNFWIIISFAFGQPAFAKGIEDRVQGNWKYLEKPVHERAEIRADRALLEMAPGLRVPDDAEGLSDTSWKSNGRAVGDATQSDDKKANLYMREMTSKVVHAAHFRWDWSAADEPKVICLKRLWKILAARVKNGDHAVPLSDLEPSLIGEAARSTNANFPFPNQAGEPGEVRVASQAVRHACDSGRFGVANWTLHDLRSTVGTRMLNRKNGLGIPKFLKYLAPNHRSATKGSVSDEVYDQNDYLDEKRDALDMWGRFLAKLVGAGIETRKAA